MKIGAAWIKKNDKGDVFMSILIEAPFVKENLIMVKNKEKKRAAEPDYIIMWNNYKKTTTENKPQNNDDDEIPF
jgi:uncharacterized protein (DUF736 family)